MVKQGIILLFLLFLFGCKPVEKSTGNSGNEQIMFYHEGLRAYLKGDYSAAESAADRVIALNPNHDGALYLKSKIYYDQGRLDESAQYLIKANHADPKNEYLASEIAYMYSAMGKYNEAGSAYERLMKTNPQEASYCFGAFENYLKGKDFKSCLRLVDQQEATFGVTIESVLNRYKVCMAQQEVKKAMQVLESAQGVFPSEPLILANLIDLYFQQSEHEKAIPLLEKLCVADPTNGLARLIYGDYLMNTGKEQKGEQLLAEAVLLDGPTIEQKAEVLLNKQKKFGCTQENIQLFQQFITLNPTELIGQTLLGDLHVICDKPSLAIEQYRVAVQLKPEAYQVWQQLLLISYKEEQWDSLLTLSKSCEQLFPIEPMPFLTEALALNNLKKYQEAKQAIEIGSEYITANNHSMEAEFMLQRGVIALGEGNVTNAKKYFVSSMDLQPENLFLKADIAKESLINPVLLPFADSVINLCLLKDPSNAKFMAINGRVLCEKGSFLLAKTWLEKAIINGYPERFGEEWLGDCAYHNGDFVRAKLHWLNAISRGNQSGRIIEKLKNL